MRTGLLTALLAVVLLAAYGYLGNGYLKEKGRYDDLGTQIIEAGNLLALIPPPPADLDARLAAAEADLAAAGEELALQVNSTHLINGILRLADEVGVKAVPLIISPWEAVTVGGQEYFVLSLNVTVTGDFAGLKEFTRRLETGEPATLTVAWLNYTFEEESGTVSVSASMNLAVYAREPSG